MNNVTTGILGASIGLLATFEIGPQLGTVLTAAINGIAATVLAIAIRYLGTRWPARRRPRRRSTRSAIPEKRSDHNI
jgi:predicted membrane-bound spermidine synthase